MATSAALTVDAILQLALDAVRVSGVGGPPWWITANLVSRGRWVAFAVLLRWLVPWLVPALVAGGGDDAPAPPADAQARATSDAWLAVGRLTIAVPLIWLAATWAVTAVRFTLLGSWETDGRVFLAPEYYRGVFLDLVPWLMAGAAVLGLRRHVT